MIKNYLKIAWRNLVKHPVFSVINLPGLSTGIAACWLIYLYIHFELTYDQYNAKADRIARVTFTIHTPESDNMVLATTPVLLADARRRSYPEVETCERNKIGRRPGAPEANSIGIVHSLYHKRTYAPGLLSLIRCYTI